MKTCRNFMLCALIWLVSFPAYAIDYVPGDVLVVLKPHNSEGRVTASSLNGMGAEALRTASFAAASGAWVKETYPTLSESGSSIYALIHSETKTPEDFARELLDNPEVLAASPNYMVHAAVVPDDTFIETCWGLNFINAYDAWETSTGSNTVYVAVLDSGIDDTNPDLTGNVATEYGTNTVSAISTSTRDDYGHGTHVAGIIGAIGNNSLGIAGVNWNVKMIPLKTLDSSGGGSFSNVISALNHVTSLIKQGLNIKAVNMSFETYLPYTPTHDVLIRMPLWRAYKELDALNKAVSVVAAGNYNAVVGQATTTTRYDSSGSLVYGRGNYTYPASFKGLDNLISVSAIDTDGSPASFTNTGADIYAPGVAILSTWLQSASRYIHDGVSLNTARGTSMAAPFVSGAAALISSVMPNLTAYQIKRMIIDGSTNGILDLRTVLAYQEEAAESLPQKSLEWTDYDDYTQYSNSSQSNSNTQDLDNGTRSNTSSGSCNGAGINIFAFTLLLPLVKKLMN